MKKICIGKETSVPWLVLMNGALNPFGGRNLALFSKSQYDVAKQLKFSSHDNIVTI